MSAVVLLFIDPIGQRVFRNVLNDDALDTNTTLEDIAPCLTAIGWPCKLVQHILKTNNGPRITHGLEFPDTQSLTAFILRWGG